MPPRIWRRLAALVFWGLALPAALALHSAMSIAAMEQNIVLRPGPLPGNAWPILEKWMGHEDDGSLRDADFLEEHLDRLMELGEASDRASALAYFQHHELYWALVDLDGDGVDEMVVYIDIVAYCGSIGCGTLELHRIADGWQARDGMTMQNPSDLCYRRNGPGGRPLFRTSREAFWWTGTRFEGVCYADCSHEGALAAATPEQRAIRDEVRKEPWCGAGQAN